jgi:virginiamycin B lyase
VVHHPGPVDEERHGRRDQQLVGAPLQEIGRQPDGAIWFTEHDASKIGRITSAGVVTEYKTLTKDSGPVGIARGSDNNLWFVEREGNQVGRITPSGVVSEYPIPSVNPAPREIITGAGRTLWFIESGTSKLGLITLPAP